MGFKNINRESTSDIIIQQIKNQIATGELKPGEKLPPERKLVELLGVSRTSIREAIQALSFSGYLKVIQGKGAFVNDRVLHYDEISNLISKIPDYSLSSLIEVRIMLEGEFARLATLRATDEEIKEIVDCFEMVKQAKNIKDFVLKDSEFHVMIATATHNPLMNALMKIFGELLLRETNKVIEYSIKTRRKSLQITTKLVEAIKERRAEDAKDLMTKHLKIIETTLVEK